MAITEKGKKGFIELPKEQRNSKRGIYYLTSKEMDLFKKYCLKNNVKPSTLIRDVIKDKIGNVKYETIADPNQLRIE
tara:strand:+ start:299 stop:529 length:231 start_codon:yes stop_codon:yes gene_type:complete